MCTWGNGPVVDRARVEHPPCLYLHYRRWDGKARFLCVE